jgi:hypothetical protein
MESRRPFTLNDNDFRISKEDHFTTFAYARNDKMAPGQSSLSRHTVRDFYGNSQSIISKTDNNDALLSLLAANGYPLTSTKGLARLHEADEYHAEINVISETLAYFEISSKRIIDVMPMIFETSFAVEFLETLRTGLTTRLRLVGESGYQHCKKYGVDEPVVERRRVELNGKMKILSDASEVVYNLFKY